jgi:signal transduction histidine kinase
MSSLQQRLRMWFGVLAQRSMVRAWLLLIMCLALTTWAWQITKSDVEADVHERFAFRKAEIIGAIHARMAAYEQVLRGALGLLSASGEIARDQWRAYVQTLRIEQNYPGIQGIGYIEWIPPAEKDTYIAHIRAEGFPGFTIRPDGARDAYMPITYLEPLDRRNQQALGYDMWSEAVRRVAMQTACDTATTQISGKVTLVQEIDPDVQAGSLMLLPYYGRGGVPVSVEERRAALVGFVYSPFRMRDLLEGTLGRALPDLRLEIFDGTGISPETLMYDSESARAITAKAKPLVLTDTDTLDIYGHTWTARLTTLPAFSALSGQDRPRLILVSGTLISLLVFGVLWSFASTRARAEALARDMTQTLDYHVEELARSNAELEAFAYSVSHDLRAPLRAIHSFASILCEDYAPQLDAEARLYLQRVQHNALRMGRLVDELLAFSRLTRHPLRKQPVALDELVRQALAALRPDYESRHVDISIGDLPSCQGDPTLLRQGLVNLLGNALKFTRTREVARIEMGCQDVGGERVYYIRDNGVGFDMQYVHKLFGVFERLHREEDFEGTGIGLALTQRIIQRHGGRIWAEGQVDKGATFYFTL